MEEDQALQTQDVIWGLEPKYRHLEDDAFQLV